VSRLHSVQETVKSPRRCVIYALSLVLIIALSASTTLFYVTNQSLQKDLDSNRLEELSWTGDDINYCLGLFAGRYYDQFLAMNYTLNFDPQADNASKSQNVNDVLAILGSTAIEVYSEFDNYIQRIEILTRDVNLTAYETISETVYTALGEANVVSKGYGGSDWMLEDFQVLGQLYDILGIDQISGRAYATSGLLAIGYNFLNLGNWWGGYIAPPPETSLTWALANATALYLRLTTWTNYTTPNMYP